MTNKNVIENKASSVKKYLKILDRYKKYSQEEIENDVDIRGAIERYLYLVIQSAVHLAEAIISNREFRKPTTLSETFHILNEEGVISDDLTKNMVMMTGFRNIISHDYGEIDYSIVYDILHNSLKDIEEFVGAVSS